MSGQAWLLVAGMIVSDCPEGFAEGLRARLNLELAGESDALDEIKVRCSEGSVVIQSPIEVRTVPNSKGLHRRVGLIIADMARVSTMLEPPAQVAAPPEPAEEEGGSLTGTGEAIVRAGADGGVMFGGQAGVQLHRGRWLGGFSIAGLSGATEYAALGQVRTLGIYATPSFGLHLARGTVASWSAEGRMHLGWAQVRGEAASTADEGTVDGPWLAPALHTTVTFHLTEWLSLRTGAELGHTAVGVRARVDGEDRSPWTGVFYAGHVGFSLR